jgi:hypothetical protein
MDLKNVALEHNDMRGEQATYAWVDVRGDPHAYSVFGFCSLAMLAEAEENAREDDFFLDGIPENTITVLCEIEYEYEYGAYYFVPTSPPVLELAPERTRVQVTDDDDDDSPF